MIICPKCVGVELVTRKVKESIVVLYCCPKCKGIWFHRGQMELVMPEAIKELAVPKDAKLGSRSCPECAKAMHVFRYPETYVQIDMCQTCLGLWIDAGEAHEIRVVRQSLKSEVMQHDEIPGVKGQLIDMVNAALDWVLHTY